MADQPNDPFDLFRQGGGWDVLNMDADAIAHDRLTPEQIEALEEQALREYELNRTIAATFSTPEGQDTLAWMREIATEGRRFDPTEENPDKAAAVGFYREGQAAFYFEVMRRMDKAELGPPAVAATAEPQPKRKKRK